MTMFSENLENRIENVVELSSVCRGEWCRALESRVDGLQEELESAGGGREFAGMSAKLREAYRLLGPDIHV
jgi:hypothetical protein